MIPKDLKSRQLPYSFHWEGELVLRFKVAQVFQHAPEVFSLPNFYLYLLKESEGLNPPGDYGLSLEDLFERFIRKTYAVLGEEVCWFERPTLYDGVPSWWYPLMQDSSEFRSWDMVFSRISEIIINTPVCKAR